MIAGLISLSQYRFERLFYLLSAMCSRHWFLHWHIRKCSLTNLRAFIIDNCLCERLLIDLLIEQLLPHLYHVSCYYCFYSVTQNPVLKISETAKMTKKHPTNKTAVKKSCRNAWLLFNRSFIHYINWPRNTAKAISLSMKSLLCKGSAKGHKWWWDLPSWPPL